MNNLIAGGSTLDGNIKNSLFQGTQLENFQIGGAGGSTDFLAYFLPRIIGLLLTFGAIAFFFMFLWGAISWILSGGDKAHVENAKGRITNALVGFVLMIGVFAVVKLIEVFFGIDILLIDIGPLVIQ
jgi:hypothetical protein